MANGLADSGILGFSRLAVYDFIKDLRSGHLDAVKYCIRLSNRSNFPFGWGAMINRLRAKISRTERVVDPRSFGDFAAQPDLVDVFFRSGMSYYAANDLAVSFRAGDPHATESVSDMLRNGMFDDDRFFHRESMFPQLETFLNQAWDAHQDLPLLLRNLEPQDDIQRAIEESTRVPPPVSACRLPSEPVSGDGTCVVCMEATAEMLLRDSKGVPTCTHVCMCEYCANEMGKSTPKCPMCRKGFVVSKVLKLHVEKPTPTPPPTPPPPKPSPRVMRRIKKRPPTKLRPIRPPPNYESVTM